MNCDQLARRIYPPSLTSHSIFQTTFSLFLSEMDAFFIFAPSILDQEDYLNIDIGTDYKISIAGLYPMYSDELEVYEKIGLEEFWHHPDYDNYSVRRKKITL